MTCFLRHFAGTPCGGPVVHKHHLIKAQTIRRHLQGHERGGRVSAKVVNDPRVLVEVCRYHHFALHGAGLPIPIRREDLPEDVELFAAEHDLGWYLDKHYPAFPIGGVPAF